MKIILLLLILTTNLFGATTGYIYLTGVVPLQLELTTTPESLASALPLDVTQTDTKIGTLTVKSNSSTGFKVTVTSTNLGKMVNTNNASKFVAYTLKRDTTVLNLVAGDTIIEASTVTNKDYNLNISYVGVPHIDREQGSYTDTITFTVTAN